MVLVNAWLANCSHSSTHTKIHCCLCCGCKDAIKLIFPLPTDEPEGNSVTAATPAMERQHCLWSQGLCVQTFPQPVWQTAPSGSTLPRASAAPLQGKGLDPARHGGTGRDTQPRVWAAQCHIHTATPTLPHLYTHGKPWTFHPYVVLTGSDSRWSHTETNRTRRSVVKKSMNLQSAEI